jgi:hypothetical protein
VALKRFTRGVGLAAEEADELADTRRSAHGELVAEPAVRGLAVALEVDGEGDPKGSGRKYSSRRRLVRT